MNTIRKIRKSFVISFLLFVTVLVGCNGGENTPIQLSPTSTAQPSSTTQPSSTPIPTQTATFTPTPKPKVLTYHVTVNCSVDKSFQVELNYSGINASQASFALNRGGFNWEYLSQKESLIKEIEATNSSGNNLQISEKKDTNNNDEFRLNVQNDETITIRYKVNVGFWDKDSDIYIGGTQLGGFIGNDYCVIEPALLFLTPKNINDVDIIRVSFSLPEGWDVVTFWEKQNDFYVTSLRWIRLFRVENGLV